MHRKFSRRNVLRTAALAGLGVSVPGVAAAQSSVLITPDVRLETRVKTFNYLKTERVILQSLDYSCGAAALATLLTYEIGFPVTEADVIAGMVATLDGSAQSNREKEGFSLLDMKNYLGRGGLRAQGFRVGPQALEQIRGAVIVFIKPRGYDHFAVFRGLRRGRVYLADPTRGNVRMSRDAFLRIWAGETGKGVVFAVENPNAAEGGEQFPLAPPFSRLPHAEVLSARQLIEVTQSIRN